MAVLPKDAKGQAFQAPITIADVSAHYPNKVEMVDLDQDGDLDLLGIALDDIVWYANDGSGNFGPEQLIDNSMSPRWHHLVDLNGDGLQDLIVSERDNDAIRLMLGNGVTFAAPQLLASPDGPLGVDAADVNGDGFLDVLYGSYKEAGWMAGDGTGSFGTSQAIITASFTEWYEDIVGADLDGDGDVDLAYSWESDNKVVWHQNLGGGSFGPQLFMPQGFNSVSQLEGVDLDLDGDIELIGAAGYSSGRVAYYNNLGGGNFSSRINIGGSIDGPEGMAISDVTGNGYPDVVVGSYYDKEVMYFANSFGSFGSKNLIYDNPTDNYVGLCLGDVDGDGFDDLVSAGVAISPNPERYQWFRNSQGGCATIQAPTALSSLILANKVRLFWSPIDQSVGCQISATRTSPPGFSATRSYLGVELDRIDVPFSILGPGTHWNWSVRCACNTSPVEATPFSATASFSVPTPRTEASGTLQLSVYPNPATDRVRLEGEGDLRILNALGETLHSGTLNGVQELNTSNWASGIYFVELGQEQQQLLIQR